MVCAHGVIQIPEDLLLDQQEPWPWAFGLFPVVETGSTLISSVGVPLGPIAVKYKMLGP